MKKKLFVILFASVLFLIGSNSADAATLRFFDENGGTQIGSMPGAFGTVTINVPEPTKENAIFDGWATNSTLATIDGTSVTTWVWDWRTNIDIYATWIQVYNIQYELDGGQVSGNPETYTEFDEVIISDPTKDGYEFLGWIDENGENLGTGLVFAEGTTGDMILTAAWKEIQEPAIDEDTASTTTETTKTTTIKNPKTGDGILFYVGLILVGFASLMKFMTLNRKTVKNN